MTINVDDNTESRWVCRGHGGIGWEEQKSPEAPADLPP
jgi:hypothetical protein